MAEMAKSFGKGATFLPHVATLARLWPSPSVDVPRMVTSQGHLKALRYGELAMHVCEMCRLEFVTLARVAKR